MSSAVISSKRSSAGEDHHTGLLKLQSKQHEALVLTPQGRLTHVPYVNKALHNPVVQL